MSADVTTRDPFDLRGTACDIVDHDRRLVAESPLWDHRDACLYWVDVARPAILRLDADTGRRTTWAFDEEVGNIALCDGGGLIAGMRSGIYRVDTATGARLLLGQPEQHRPEMRFNDGAVDPAGRYWTGSLDTRSLQPRGRLWRIGPSMRADAMMEGLTCPNGLCWSVDGRRMYFSDSFNRQIDVFDFDVCDGVAYNRRPFVRIASDRGVGDGATVDAEGCLWSANYGGWCVTRYDPSGRIDRVVQLPFRTPTSCCFGDVGLDRLYVTSSTRLSARELEQQPVAGKLIVLDVGVRGVPKPCYAP